MSPRGTELPIRVYDDGAAGITVACLCEAETAYVKPGSEPYSVIALAARASSTVVRGLTADSSPAGIVRLVLHAKTCLRGQNIARGAA